MSYELRRDEAIGEGLRRICRKQIEFALVIVAGEHEPEDTPVHETRKHLKKARAALRLVRKEIGRGLFKRQDHLLRDVSRLISDIRDAEVRLQTVRQLQGITQRQRQRSYHNVEQMLMLELENFLAAYAEWQAQALPMLTRARDEIDDWSVAQLGPPQLQGAVQETYKCGREALAEAKASLAPEDFHALRGEAKQLWYQLRILRPANFVVLKNLSDELHALGDLLGRAHDLCFLGDRLRKERGRPAFNREGQELMAVIEASRSDLQRSACELAERFFAERPRDFGTRVASWLDQWANEKSDSVAGELVADNSQSAALV